MYSDSESCLQPPQNLTSFFFVINRRGYRKPILAHKRKGNPPTFFVRRPAIKTEEKKGLVKIFTYNEWHLLFPSNKNRRLAHGSFIRFVFDKNSIFSLLGNYFTDNAFLGTVGECVEIWCPFELGDTYAVGVFSFIDLAFATLNLVKRRAIRQKVVEIMPLRTDLENSRATRID